MPSRKDLANAIRALSMDAVQKADSGHPGMPMGMADIAEVLWNDFLQHNPKNPHWFNRDRFILSNGHGSMLQYALLHLSGYDLSMEDIKNFRQLHSKTPGHPEYGDTPGVETTTGPLGQGLANGVGMAIAEKTLGAQFNREGFSIVNHYTYVFAGDGCLMEGISHEACSLAGTLGLGKLIVFYDDNDISIDGQVGGWFTDDSPLRFESYGWQVIEDVDGQDAEAIKEAIIKAHENTEQPTLICCKTVIGYGAPNLGGSHKVHGSPLGADEIAATRINIGWSYPPFEIPQKIYKAWNAETKGKEAERSWNEDFAAYQKEFPQLAEEFLRRVNGKLPSTWKENAEEFIQSCQKKSETMATRKASLLCLDAFGPQLSELLGGSADLTGSNLTWWSGSEAIRQKDAHGNYIHYGVREFGMFAIMNGIALHSGFIPYGGTFLTFVDYGRNALRLAAMMKTKAIFVLSHDSIGLGEDGPTHQPIEHANMLRLTPDLHVWRPCDTTETAVAWQSAIDFNGPSALLLTRQNVPHQFRDTKTVELIARGAYVLKEAEGNLEAIIIATGSEVSLAIDAANILTKEGLGVRVVSMPCTSLFDKQPDNYKESVLPSVIRNRVIVEAGTTGYWYKYAGFDGKVIGIDRYGYSAPYKQVYAELGISVNAIVDAVKEKITLGENA